MNSRIYAGTLRHERLHEAAHGFEYGLHMYALDLDELDELDRSSSASARWPCTTATTCVPENIRCVPRSCAP